MSEPLHYEKTANSFVFAPDCCVSEFLRSRRTNNSDNHNNDPSDDGAAADVGDTDDYDALLNWEFSSRDEKRARNRVPFFLLSFLRTRSFGGLGFFFRLTDHRRNRLQFFAFAQIHQFYAHCIAPGLANLFHPGSNHLAFGCD